MKELHVSRPILAALPPASLAKLSWALVAGVAAFACSSEGEETGQEDVATETTQPGDSTGTTPPPSVTPTQTTSTGAMPPTQTSSSTPAVKPTVTATSPAVKPTTTTPLSDPDPTSTEDDSSGNDSDADDSNPSASDTADGPPTEGEGGSSDPGTDVNSAGAGAGTSEPEETGGAANLPVGEGDEMPWFSFFTTSLDGLLSLAPDPENGFGGDLGGLAGADEICATLAKQSNPTDAKTWRAFLSTGGFDGDPPVDAIDRIGEGPWYDYNGRLLSENVAGLIPGDDGRPDGDAQLTEMFTDEYGDPIKPSDDIDNHDTLTGSGDDGRLYVEGDPGEVATCGDWTNNTLHAENVGGGGGPGGSGGGGRVPVGHSWPRSSSNGRSWTHEHDVNGCEPGVFIGVGGGAPADNFTVGGGGGYGAFYCFALGAVAP